MLAIVGLLFLLGCVFGSYLLHGGSMGPVIKALPYEFMAIGGAAIGALIMANSMHGVKHTVGGLLKALKGAAYHKADYIEMLSLLYFLVRLASTKGNMALEPHIEKPEESSAFQAFPKILKNHHATVIICDYLRMIGMNADDPHQIEDVMARELKKTLHEEMHGAHALQGMADGLPALGIVAAVLGVIKTMSSIDQPPAVLGGMIGSALVGTFMGVLLAYGMVAPMAGRLKQVLDADEQIFNAVKQVIIASLHGYPQPLVVESARSGLSHANRPGLSELLDALRGR